MKIFWRQEFYCWKLLGATTWAKYQKSHHFLLVSTFLYGSYQITSPQNRFFDNNSKIKGPTKKFVKQNILRSEYPSFFVFTIFFVKFTESSEKPLKFAMLAYTSGALRHSSSHYNEPRTYFSIHHHPSPLHRGWPCSFWTLEAFKMICR